MHTYKFNCNYAQAHALRCLWLRDRSSSYVTFLSTVQQGYDCLMVPLWGMWLGIESDGYTHS